MTTRRRLLVRPWLAVALVGALSWTAFDAFPSASTGPELVAQVVVDDSPLPFDPAPPADAARARVKAMTELGRKLFYDASLSASGTMACSSCHDPARGFGPPDDQPVRKGGVKGNLPGTRAVPGLTYAELTPFFDQHHYEDDDGDGGLDAGPTGGRMWDGRVSRGRDQARFPLLAAHEMANRDPQAVVAKVAASAMADDLRALYGADVFSHPDKAFDGIAEALEVYQEYPPDFAPFTSKYDAVIRGDATLTPEEQRGLAAFNDPERGNCARCHISKVSGRGSLPLFTDFGLVAVAVPRNAAIPANRNPRHFDLGLCGPDRKDFKDRADYCGRFKTPSLRNVALRPVFFHNGIFNKLRDAVAFYAGREVEPERWYHVDAQGRVRKYDDLPARYHKNIDTEAPFDRRPGDRPPLSEQEIDDVTAFLKTLTDGYVPTTTHADAGPDSRNSTRN